MLTKPEGGYGWVFEQGDRHGKGHSDSDWKRPDIKCPAGPRLIFVAELIDHNF